MTRRRPRRWAAASLSMALAVAACSSATPSASAPVDPTQVASASAAASEPAPSPEPTGEIRMAVTPVYGALPSIGYFTDWPFFPMIAVDQPLYGKSSQGEPAPGFAESYTVNADSTEWTFQITPGKQWSDGTPATAKDVAFTLNLLKDSIGTPDELGVGWLNTRGAENIESVTAVDDQTVVIKLKQPSAYPIDQHTIIVPEHVYAGITPRQLLDGWLPPDPQVGSGPFFTAEWKADEFVRVERNPYYAGPGPNVASIIFSFPTNEEAAAAGLANGEFDFVWGLPNASVQRLEGDPDVATSAEPSGLVNILAFNQRGIAGGATTDALADVAFRDAIGYAIDQQELLDKAGGGFGVITHSPMHGLMGSYRDLIETDLASGLRAFDLEQAKAKLDAAGYVLDADGRRLDKGGAPIELLLLAPSSDAVKVTTSQFVSDWLGQLGIKVSSQALDWSVLPDQLTSGDWDLASIEWWGQVDPADPFAPWASSFKENTFTNGGAFQDDEYDAVFAKLKTSADPEQRKAYAVQLAQILQREIPMIPLFNVAFPHGYRTDRFTGWKDGPDASFEDYTSSLWQTVRPTTP